MNRSNNRAATVLAVVVGLAASCGGGTDESASTAPVETASTVSEAASSETTAAAPSETTEAGPEVEPVEWSGPEFVPLVEARMGELAAPIGQPYSAEAVASVFEMPPAFPAVPDSVVTGIIGSWDVDPLDGEMEELRIVGTDSVIAKDELTEFAFSIGDNAAVDWKSASVSDGGIYPDGPVRLGG